MTRSTGVLGLSYEWLLENRLVVYTLTSVSMNILSEWERVALANLEQAANGELLCIVYDMRSPGVALLYALDSGFDIYNIGISAPGKERAMEIMRQHPDLTVLLAVLMSPYLSGQFVARRIRRTEVPDGRLKVRSFFDKESAFEWLNVEAALAGQPITLPDHKTGGMPDASKRE